MSSTFDMTELRRSVKRVGSVTGKEKGALMKTAARGFLRNIIAITPPASRGTTGAAAKKAGEAAIASDLHRIFTPQSDSSIAAIVDFQGARHESSFGHKGAKAIGTVTDVVLARSAMTAFHQARRRADGRVGGVRKGSAGMTNRDRAAYLTTGLRRMDLPNLDLGIVRTQDFNWFLKLLQKNVGYLAAGWNKAAAYLGVTPPAWVKRHPDAPGEVKISITETNFHLEISNAVGFVGNVRDYDERIQKALDYEAAGLNRQADFLLEKAIRHAGF